MERDRLLKLYNFNRESIYGNSAGPGLYRPVLDSNPTVNIRAPLTPVLGLSIAAQNISHIEGTGGLYFAEGGNSKKILLITARHVVFPPTESINTDYTCKNTSMPRHNILLLGMRAYADVAKSIKIKIGNKIIIADYYKEQISTFETKVRNLTEAGKDDEEIEDVTRELKIAKDLLGKWNDEMKILDKFRQEVNNPHQHVLGHVISSPHITLNAGMEGFTEDYAIVELDRSKIEKSFLGNVIDLGMF